MSRIGKKPIQLTDQVEIEVKGGGRDLIIRGKLGELDYNLPRELMVERGQENRLVVKPRVASKRTRELWGLWRSILANAVTGVSEGFKKQLELRGVGYRAVKKGAEIELTVGLSHPVIYSPPEGIELEVEKNIITVSGIDKQQVGQVAAEIRAVRPPEPYKGKGVRYVGEEVRLKPGKAAKVGGEGLG